MSRLSVLGVVVFGMLASHASLATEAAEESAAGDSRASALLAAAIRYHDPKGLWRDGRFRLVVEGERPDGTASRSELTIDNHAGRFAYSSLHDEALIEAEVGADGCVVRLDGSTDISDEAREKHRLTCERMEFLRNYYTYLWGLPMKLLDPGTILDPEVKSTDFMGREVLQLKVTYEAEVGGDTWYFYFDPSTYALVGYRFYHDESEGDGEYILLEGETAAGSLRLPRKRTWYTNAEDELLGIDTLSSLSRSE